MFSGISRPEQATHMHPLQIGRALLVRNHAAGLQMIIRVFDIFPRQNDMASYAGASLSILSDPYGERILSKENFAVVKVSDAQDRRSACSRWLTNCIYQSLQATPIQLSPTHDDRRKQDSARIHSNPLSVSARLHHHHHTSRPHHVAPQRTAPPHHARSNAVEPRNPL